MSEYVITRVDNPDELYHHGVKGMKWGHRKGSSAGINAIKRLSNPNSYIKKDGYQKIKNPIGTTVSKDGYNKTKLPGSVRSIVTQRKIKKAYAKMAKQKVKDLYKKYGDIEDQIDYSRHGDKKKNAKLENEMTKIQNEINKYDKKYR